MDVLTELNRGDDRDVVAWHWGYAPGLVDRALDALDAWETLAAGGIPLD